jgi:hypothetical protein
MTQERARERIAGLIQKYNRLGDKQRKGITEAGVVHQFLDPLCEALG